MNRERIRSERPGREAEPDRVDRNVRVQDLAVWLSREKSAEPSRAHLLVLAAGSFTAVALVLALTNC